MKQLPMGQLDLLLIAIILVSHSHLCHPVLAMQQQLPHLCMLITNQRCLQALAVQVLPKPHLQVTFLLFQVLLMGCIASVLQPLHQALLHCPYEALPCIMHLLWKQWRSFILSLPTLLFEEYYLVCILTSVYLTIYLFSFTYL